MGGTTSKNQITNDITKNILNETDISMIKKTMNENIMKTIVNNSKSCSGYQENANKSNTTLKNISGDINFSDQGVNQSIGANFNLSCIQSGQMNNLMASDIASAVKQEIENKFSLDDQTAIAAFAEASAKTGMGGFINPADLETSTTNKFQLNVTNKMNTKLENIINNKVEQVFDTSEIQSCAGSMSNVNESNLNFENLDSGKVNIFRGLANQTIQSKFEQKCLQESKTINSTLNSIKDTFDGIARTGAEIQSETKSEVKLKADVKSAGIEDVIDSVFGGISGIFGSYTMIFLIIAIVIVVIIMAFIYSKMKQDNDDE